MTNPQQHPLQERLEAATGLNAGTLMAQLADQGLTVVEAAEVERLRAIEEERWQVVVTRNAACNRAEAAEAEVVRLRALWMGAAATHFDAMQRLTQPRHCRQCGHDVTVEP